MWSLLFTGESASAQMSLTGVQKQRPERKERLGPKGEKGQFQLGGDTGISDLPAF